ncbi:MAG: hypothetical protein LBG58_05565 [Planctomycetaceae bacterium]|jgi:hypothetical protein|nr:hypothetical protein [Planctomycetaceae bacterium]
MSITKNPKTNFFFKSFRYISRCLLVIGLLWTMLFVSNTIYRISGNGTTVSLPPEQNRKIIETNLDSEHDLPPLITALSDESGEWIFEHAQWNYHQKIISEINLEQEWKKQPETISVLSDSPSAEEDSIVKLINMLNIPIPFFNTLNRTEKDNDRFYHLFGNGTRFRLTTSIHQGTERIIEGKFALQINETEWLILYFSPIHAEQHRNITDHFPPCPESGHVVCTKTDRYGNIRITFFDTDIDSEHLKTYWQNHHWTVSVTNNVPDTSFKALCRKQNRIVHVTGKKEKERVISLMLVSQETVAP